jgi:uncharacterized protein (DUF362 family)
MFDVHFFDCPDYGPGLEDVFSRSVSDSGFSFCGKKVLVKPNLVAARNFGLGCTHPEFVSRMCRVLYDAGARVSVADSPAFGTAAKVARKIGLENHLKPLGVKVDTLGRGRRRQISGYKVLVSEAALNADLIVNLPRLKAHSQVRVSAGVKNLFGCVCGMQKALWHARLGSDRSAFAALILDISRVFPRVFSVVDAVRVMHGSGPIHGSPFLLGKVVSGDDPLAVDTAIYSCLGLTPEEVPLYGAAWDREMPGADERNIRMKGDVYGIWEEMQLPRELKSADFSPGYLAMSILKRLRQRMFPG